MKSKPVVYETLNGMRGLAALAVVFFHAGAGLLPHPIAPGGYLAVDVFFVLSGFVICHAYEARLLAGLSFRQFALARLIRFYPLLVLAVMIGLARALAGMVAGSGGLTPSQAAIAAFTSLFLIPAPVTAGGNLFVLNSPLWSLSFELAVNLAYAALVPRLSNSVLICIAAVAAIVMATFALMHGSNDVGSVVATAPGGVARAVFGFSVGVLIYRHRGFKAPRLPVSAIFLALVILLCLPVPPTWRVTYDLTFALVVVPAMVSAGVMTEPAQRWLAIVRYLGVISFAIYAIHGPLMGITMTLAEMIGLSPTLAGTALILGLLVICPLIDRLYDVPLRRLLQRHLLRVPVPAESAP